MNLKTKYLGLELAHPIVPSASPLSRDLEGIRLLEDAGAPAIVLLSLFEEQIRTEAESLDYFLDRGNDSYAEAVTYYPDLGTYNRGTESYLELIRSAKQAVNVPVIASLNGATPGGWTLYAREMEKAGADAIELNTYFLATDPRKTGFEVERDYVQILREVRSAVKVPIAVKLSPYFSSTSNMAWQLAEGGADGLVLFNRFYQPDLDLENLTVTPALNLSTSAELRLPLRWIAILHGRVPVDLALTTGVHTAVDVIKGVMAGAKVVMVASELLQNGIQRVSELRRDVEAWLGEHEYESIEQMTGSLSQARVEDPGGFERANYMRTLQSWQPKNV